MVLNFNHVKDVNIFWLHL